MGCYSHIVHVPQWAAGRKGFLLENVQESSRNPFLLKSVDQALVTDDITSSISGSRPCIAVEVAFLNMLHVNEPMLSGNAPEATNIVRNRLLMDPEDIFSFPLFGRLLLHGSIICCSILQSLPRGTRHFGLTFFMKI